MRTQEQRDELMDLLGMHSWERYECFDGPDGEPEGEDEESEGEDW